MNVAWVNAKGAARHDEHFIPRSALRRRLNTSSWGTTENNRHTTEIKRIIVIRRRDKEYSSYDGDKEILVVRRTFHPQRFSMNVSKFSSIMGSNRRRLDLIADVVPLHQPNAADAQLSLRRYLYLTTALSSSRLRGVVSSGRVFRRECCLPTYTDPCHQRHTC